MKRFRIVRLYGRLHQQRISCTSYSYLTRNEIYSKSKSLEKYICSNTPHFWRREKASPTHTARDREKRATLRTTNPSHNKRREIKRWRRTQENGVSTIKSLGITLNNVAPRSHLWSIWRLPIQRPILIINQISKEGRKLSMLNWVPLSLPPKSDQANQKNQRKGNASFTHKFG